MYVTLVARGPGTPDGCADRQIGLRKQRRECAGRLHVAPGRDQNLTQTEGSLCCFWRSRERTKVGFCISVRAQLEPLLSASQTRSGGKLVRFRLDARRRGLA